MLVLIDESGDSGFKLTRGSTSHFVVGMVIFNEFAEAERASAGIAAARAKLRVKPEFRFSKASDDIRDAFFQAVASFRFRVRAVVVDKAKVYSPHLRSDTEDFHRFFVRMLLTHDDHALDQARVKIDGSGSRQFKNELARRLRELTGAGKVHSVKFADSHRDNLIQLADMATGAIARSYMGARRDDAGRWRAMLRPKIDNVWEFG